MTSSLYPRLTSEMRGVLATQPLRVRCPNDHLGAVRRPMKRDQDRCTKAMPTGMSATTSPTPRT